MNSEQATVNLEEAKRAFLEVHEGEYFWCEREHCLMSWRQCIRNQVIAAGKLRQPYHGVAQQFSACERASCWDCQQGEEIAGKAKGKWRRTDGE